MALAAAALITAGCGGSNGEQSVPASSAPSTVSPSDMSNEQAPPNRLVIEVTIKGGDVTPTKSNCRQRSRSRSSSGSTATPPTSCV
jgi:hypothetical protein